MEGLDRREAITTTAVAVGVGALSAKAQAQSAPNPGSLDTRIARGEDAVAVENLMGLYPSFMHVGMYRDILSRFALKQPDVRVEIRGIGRWEGSAAVQKAIILIPERIDEEFAAVLQRQFPNRRFEPRSGRQFEMPLASAVIHVARDGKTAKGLWCSWGAQTGVGRDGKIGAFFVAEKYAVDFIKEDGTWKFWHFQIVPIFRTPYEASWTETSKMPAPIPAYYRGTLAPTKSSPKVTAAYDPRPPVAYETFAKTWSY